MEKSTALIEDMKRALASCRTAKPRRSTTTLDDGRRTATTNFESPFTPRTSLRSPRNFGNARFRRFANFDFSTPKKNCRKKIRLFFSFSAVFRGARLFLTSKSSSSRFFALDGQIFRSIRCLGLIFRLFTVRTSSCGGRLTEVS